MEPQKDQKNRKDTSMTADTSLGLGIGLLVTVILAHTTGGRAHGLVGHHSHALILNLAVVLLPHPAYLTDVYAALHELGHYLALRCALGVLLYDKLHHLVVAHRRLGHHAGRHCQHEDEQ